MISEGATIVGKGKIFHDTPFTYTDQYSEREIQRLTDYLGHSHHFYFTDPCWFNGNRSLVFCSDRENRTNLFRYDLDTGTITQMTDLDNRTRIIGCVSEVNNAVYFWQGSQLLAVDLNSFAEQVVMEVGGEIPPSALKSRANPTADGKYICAQLMEEIPQEKASVSFAYSRFREYFDKKPLTRIARIEIATGKLEIIHEDRRYMGHVNTSPTRPELLTFCHEGPWHLVEQRIWGLNIHTGETWKIRPQAGDNLAVGHEYWFAEGERIGYHGLPRDGQGNHIFGSIRWDNTGHQETNFPFHSTHFHSLDETTMVGDGTPALSNPAQPYIQLFKKVGDEYIGPKILAYHRSTFNDQHAHCHPRFTPDGKSILYTSDLTGYSNLYLLDVGSFDDLPDLTE
jgi:oligogalacturonide lyase